MGVRPDWRAALTNECVAMGLVYKSKNRIMISLTVTKVNPEFNIKPNKISAAEVVSAIPAE